MGKRDELKAKRKRQLIQQRLTVIGIIVVGAVLIAAFFNYSQFTQTGGSVHRPHPRWHTSRSQPTPWEIPMLQLNW